MRHTIVLGHDCPDGKLVACPFDEKNLTTDWIDDFLFDGDCARPRYESRRCGYVDLEDEDMLCEVEWCDNCLTYHFPNYNYLSDVDVSLFIKKLKTYLEDCDNLTIEVFAQMEEKNIIRVYFYSRYED